MRRGRGLGQWMGRRRGTEGQGELTGKATAADRAEWQSWALPGLPALVVDTRGLGGLLRSWQLADRWWCYLMDWQGSSYGRARMPRLDRRVLVHLHCRCTFASTCSPVSHTALLTAVCCPLSASAACLASPPPTNTGPRCPSSLASTIAVFVFSASGYEY